MDKSKIMCFNKGGRNVNCNFNLGQEEVNYTKSYSYLGNELANSFTFKLAKETLNRKAMRTL